MGRTDAASRSQKMHQIPNTIAAAQFNGNLNLNGSIVRMCRTSWNHSCTTERLGSLCLPGKRRIEIRYLAECDERRKPPNTQVEQGTRNKEHEHENEFSAYLVDHGDGYCIRRLSRSLLPRESLQLKRTNE